MTILNDRPPIAVDDDLQVEGVSRDAAAEARTRGKLGAILIDAANKNSMTMVVGTPDTVLSFDYGHGNPPYYVGKENPDEDEPVITCY